MMRFCEEHLREFASLIELPAGHVYRRLPACTVYASMGLVGDQYRNVCVVLGADEIQFFAVQFDDRFVSFCDFSSLSDDLRQVLFVFFHEFWMESELFILPGQDECFYRDLAAKLDLGVVENV